MCNHSTPAKIETTVKAEMVVPTGRKLVENPTKQCQITHNEIVRIIKAKGLKENEISADFGGRADNGGYENFNEFMGQLYIGRGLHYNIIRDYTISIPRIAGILGVQTEYLFLIGEGKTETMFPEPAPNKTENEVAAERLITEIHRLMEIKGIKSEDFKWNAPGWEEWESYQGIINSINGRIEHCNKYEKTFDFAKSLVFSARSAARNLGVTVEYLDDIATGKQTPMYIKKADRKPESVDAAPVFKAKTVAEKDKEMKAKTKKGKGKKKRSRILPAGIVRYVHVYVPALQERFNGAEGNPLCCVRALSNLSRRNMYSKVEFLGAAELAELSEPLPGTNGRGICVMITKGALRVHD